MFGFGKNKAPQDVRKDEPTQDLPPVEEVDAALDQHAEVAAQAAADQAEKAQQDRDAAMAELRQYDEAPKEDVTAGVGAAAIGGTMEAPVDVPTEQKQ